MNSEPDLSGAAGAAQPKPGAARREPANQRPDALRVEGLSKRFGATNALTDVTLTVTAGEVHALVGHNGSGKSTLVKMLSGYHRPDSGSVMFGGTPVSFPISKGAQEAGGVAFVHQDIGLVPSASVLENVKIGRFDTGFARHIKWRMERRQVGQMLASFDLDVDPDAPVSGLSASERTIVGLIRAVQTLDGREGGLLVLDEATAALPAHETEELLTAVRSIAARGISVLLITHHLNEPLLLADRVSVLRDGRLVFTGDVEGKTERDLAELIIGKERRSQSFRPSSRVLGERALAVTALGGGRLSDVSFEVKAGEVLGLTGLSGSGHDDIPYLLHGLRPMAKGTVSIGDRRIGTMTPRTSIDAGMALVSGDRATAGGVGPATVSENMSAPSLRRLVNWARWIFSARERHLVHLLIQRFDVRPGVQDAPFSTMSGGNQQKALIGRWLDDPPKVLLLDEPTSGVDIGAVDSILETLRSFADDGGAVVFASTQYEDLARIADRVLVFADGRVVSELTGESITPHELLSSAYADGRSPSTDHN